MFIIKRVVDLSLRELMVKEYPGLNKNIGYWGLMEWLCFGSCFDEKYNQLVISQAILAKIEGKQEQLANKNYIAKEFLMAFRADVLTDKESVFNWTTWSSVEGEAGKSRRVKDFKLKSEVMKALDDSLINTPVNPVYFRDGKKASDKTVKADREDCKMTALESLCTAGCLEAMDVLKYMNGLAPNRFSKLRTNMFDAMVEAQIYLQDRAKSGLREDLTVLKLLGAISSQPMPFYFAPKEANTVRLYGFNESILRLPRKVRKVITKGWVTVDLKSAQLAICAKEWDVPVVNGFLKSGGSVWASLFAQFGFTFVKGSDDYEYIKDLFKKSLYSLMFGMEVQNIKRNLTIGLKKYIKSAGSIYFKNPIIEVMTEARDSRLKEIHLAGEATTAFGKKLEVKWLPDEEKYNVNSILAEVAQSTELALLHPIIELAKTTDEFAVVMWLHDGCSIEFKDKSKKGSIIKKIKAAVQLKIEELGVSTELEIE